MIAAGIFGVVAGILLTLSVEAAALRWLLNRIIKDFNP